MNSADRQHVEAAKMVLDVHDRGYCVLRGLPCSTLEDIKRSGRFPTHQVVPKIGSISELGERKRQEPTAVPGLLKDQKLTRLEQQVRKHIADL